MTKTLRFPDVEQANLGDWALILGTLRAVYRPDDFATGLAFVNRIGEAAEQADHHPDLVLKYGVVALTLTSHDVGGVTERDLDLARTITAIAADMGIESDRDSVAGLELALDTRDIGGNRAFWRAVTGWQDVGEDQVEDADRLTAPLWFQSTDSQASDRQRFHLDLTVPRDLAEDRVQRAVAAGGTLVDASAAPRFWVLADPEGNKICICTAEGR